MNQDEFIDFLQALNPTGPIDWAEVKTLGFRWLLAHAHDGVIWGAFDDQGQLTTSHDIAQDRDIPNFRTAQLRTSTLQQLRAFGEEAELQVWNTGDSWQALLLRDGNDYIEEYQTLWGTRGQAYGTWTLLSDGEQGLRQLLPLDWKKLSIPSFSPASISYQKGNQRDEQALTAAILDANGERTSVVGWRPARLVVRQTLEYDRDGIAFVKHTRCMRIEWEQESANEQPA